jgi:glycosidase
MTAGDEGRDHARTPMQWDATPSAGFTATGTRPWLPCGNTARNVAAQRENPDSMLHLCRNLIALRSAAFSGRIASYQQLPGPAGVWAYQADDLVVTANLAGQPATLDHEPGPVLATSAGPGALHGRTLAPWTGIIARRAVRRG